MLIDSLTAISPLRVYSLPGLIQAFFISSKVGAGYLERARNAHAAFQAAYPHAPAVPLVWMDLTNWAEPFSPVADD